MSSLCRSLLVCLSITLGFCFFPSSGHAAAKPYDIVKKLKDTHDRLESEMLSSMSCTQPGSHCTSSGDCCGTSMCEDGFCSDPGINNLPPGAHCTSSGDCAGTSMCEDHFCSDPGISDVQPGGHCTSSGDCAGTSMCEDNFCSDPGINNLPPGAHCTSSGDCEGTSMCVDNYCS